MFGLPKSTEYNHRIPKQEFYKKIDISPKLKRAFVDQIKIFYWRNIIAPRTVNIALGEKVTEIEVIEVKLNEQMLTEPVLKQIDQSLPYHILFLLELDGQYQAWAAYKEASAGTNAFKVHSYYHTDWMAESELPLKLEGLNTDKVYENFVRQIGGEVLTAEGEETLQQSVERDIHRQDLQKQIAALQAQVRNEKQLNKQVRLNAELKKLKKELEDL